MRLSIAMCTYNGSLYLQEQLDSIASQTRLPDEVVICDDQSSDGTAGIVEKFAATAPFPVKLYVNENNLGSNKNFEKAIALCQGDIIALADQDDVWSPTKLDRMETVLASSPDTGLVFSDAEIVDDKLRPLGLRLSRLTANGRERKLIERGRLLDVLLQRNVVTGATMVFRSKFKGLLLPFPTSPNIGLLHDGWIALAIACCARIAFIPESLVQYRQHATQQTGVWPRGKEIAANNEMSRRADFENMARYYEQQTREWEFICGRLESPMIDSHLKRPLIEKPLQLREKMIHFHNRAGFPKTKIRRIAFIFKELISFRYHRCSNGFYSFVKDLLLAT